MKNADLEKPVFIVGVPRSGTTMLWSILLRHPEFKGEKMIPSWNSETSIFHKFPKILEDFFTPGKWPFWNEYFVADRKRFDSWLVDCVRDFIIKATEARKAKRPLEKTPNHLENIDLIERAFPQAKIIHIVRHPLDVFASMRRRSFVTAPRFDPWLKVTAEQFAQDYERKIVKVDHYRGSLKIFTVRYEDLTNDAEVYIAQICKFLKTILDISIIYGEKPLRKIHKFPFQSHIPVINSNTQRNIVSEKEESIIIEVTKKTREAHSYE
ncbi:MAG: sulfotransferase [Patescibacteria group bacterium]